MINETNKTEGSKSEFAKYIGKSKAYVTKLDKQGRLVFINDKILDFEKSKQLIAETADPSKIPLARMSMNDGEGDVENVDDISNVDNDKLQSTQGVTHRYQKSRAEKENYTAWLKKVEYEKAIGELVHREGVNMGSFKIARILRDKLLALPNRLAPRVTVETNQKNNYALIMKEIEDTIGQIQQALSEVRSKD